MKFESCKIIRAKKTCEAFKPYSPQRFDLFKPLPLDFSCQPPLVGDIPNLPTSVKITTFYHLIRSPINPKLNPLLTFNF